jgi:hypothetical protein
MIERTYLKSSTPMRSICAICASTSRRLCDLASRDACASVSRNRAACRLA